MINSRDTFLAELQARELLDIAHAAWSREDVEAVLACFVDDLHFWSNASPRGDALTVTGKSAFRTYLHSIDVAERISVREHFRLVDGVGRARIDWFVRHKRTGHTLTGSYRQLVGYREGKICRLEEYHDAARMAAFWRLIAGEDALAETAP